MVVSASKIKRDLKRLWKIDGIWIFDRNFFVHSIQTVEEMIKGLSSRKLDFIPEVWDCDNFARKLHSDVMYWQYLCIQCKQPVKKHYPWAFGTVAGVEFKGRDINHAINIAYCREGIFLIEPQSDAIWEADPDQDQLYYINF